MPIRVLLALRHRIVSQALGALVEADPALKVVGAAGDGHEALALADTVRPDAVVLDLRLSGLNGADVARRLLAAPCPPVVVMLAGSPDDPMAGEALRAGAVRCLPPSAPFAELAAAVRGLADPAVPGGAAPRLPAFRTLSPREREVLQLLAEGRTTKATAAVMGVNTKTAETHRRNVMRKLAIDDVAGLTKYAIRQGLTAV